jgi:hypothetical protein
MFGLMAVLGGFIFFFEQEMPTTDERRDLEKKVLAVEKSQILALTIVSAGQEVRLERQDQESVGEDAEDSLVGLTPQAIWRLVKPLEARADGGQVESLLTSLADLEHQRRLGEIDREDAGLANPEVRLTITTAEGDTELLFGAELPASSDRIVGFSDRDEAYVVASTLVDDLKKEPALWRDKRLFTGTRSAIERVVLEQAGEALVLVRRGEDFWVESPFTDQADSAAVNTLLTAITGLTVTTFLDQPLLVPSAMGLEPAAATLEVTLQGGQQPFRLELGDNILELGDNNAEEGPRYGRTAGELFELNAGLAPSFAVSPDAWRSRDWASLQVFQVDTATFVDSSGSITMRREGGEWLRGDDTIEYTTASDLLYAVAEAKAERVLDLTGSLAAPDLTVTLTTEDREEVLYLYITDDGALASREGRDAVLAMSTEAAQEVRSKLEALRSAEVLVEEEGEDEGDLP